MQLLSLPSFLILAASAVIWLLFALLTFKPSAATVSQYCQTKGRITKCWKDELDDPDAEPAGDYWIFYEYEWEGQTHKGEDVADEAEDRSGYATGREVPVWVHAAKHGNSMLHDPGIPPARSEIFGGPFFFLVLVTWLVLVGLATLLGIGTE